LQSILSSPHQEVPNSLGDGISDISDSYLEISIDSGSDLFHEQVRSLTHIILRGSLLRRWLVHLTTTLSIWVGLLRLLLLGLCLGYDVSPLGQVVAIICEVIVLLSINNGFNYGPSFLSFILNHSHDDVHNLGY
jgi:hypothetical protein